MSQHKDEGNPEMYGLTNSNNIRFNAAMVLVPMAMGMSVAAGVLTSRGLQRMFAGSSRAIKASRSSLPRLFCFRAISDFLLCRPLPLPRTFNLGLLRFIYKLHILLILRVLRARFTHSFKAKTSTKSKQKNFTFSLQTKKRNKNNYSKNNHDCLKF